MLPITILYMDLFDWTSLKESILIIICERVVQESEASSNARLGNELSSRLPLLSISFTVPSLLTREIFENL